uniref:F-box/kelch-repeat protein At1g22040 isoform X2 n=1 Tax=Elaeis guineensis var. tenera TaxID=51953 RepID=A0A8N4EQQ1_ELAGV|nr:F-box/kelch-repeat protein At1g22040 isoform X2 [Elaeis guineensis]
MGSFLSFPVSKTQDGELSELSQNDACKRQRMLSSYYDENPRLIPALPDEISLQILARLPRIFYLNMKRVCRSWKAAITSHEVYHLRRELGMTEEWLYILTKVEENKLLWHALDPVSRKWQRLPPMPYVLNEGEPKRVFSGLRIWNVVGSSIKIADFIRGLLWRRDASDHTPFCGCAVAAVDGCLYVLGGFSGASMMKSVWKYDPCINSWQEVSSMTIGRAFCKTALLNDKLYVVGGINRGRNGVTPLRSAEVFDPQTGMWTQLPSMPFSKAQMIPTAFLADILKPIATGMASYRGRLCVPQSLYSWPFFFDVGGEIYDPENDSWVEMPTGMGDGWPARQAGTKLSVVVNGELYALDPSSSLDSGDIKRYDHQEDVWKVVIQRVPIHDFTDSESPYLLAGFLGKLHVVTKDDENRVAILQADLQKHKQSSPSTSSAPPANFRPENPVSIVDRETDIWKIATVGRHKDDVL